MKQKFISGSIKSLDKGKREATFVVSDGQVDRHGESINPSGWMVENYMDNPIVLFGHNYKDLPIGKTLKVWVENGEQVLARMKFATHDFANKVWDLIEGGFLNATSVGFIPLKLDEEGKYTWKEQELLEISVVPVPANPRALGKKELAIFKEIEEQTGEDILKEEEEPEGEPETDEDEGDAGESETEETKDLDIAAIITQAVADGIAQYKQQVINEQQEELEQATAKQKEALIALRDHLKSGDKALGQALRKLKDIVDTK